MASEVLVQAVADENLKVGAGAPAFYGAQRMSDSVAHAKRLDILAESALGSIINRMNSADPAEAVSVLKMMSGNESAATIAQLLASLASGQQGSKVAGNTPPVTP